MVWYELILNGDYGFALQLIPVMLTIFISWALSSKDLDILFIQFPIAFALKLIFPFFSWGILMISFALFALNLIGSGNDILGKYKSTPIQSITDFTSMPSKAIRNVRVKSATITNPLKGLSKKTLERIKRGKRGL